MRKCLAGLHCYRFEASAVLDLQVAMLPLSAEVLVPLASGPHYCIACCLLGCAFPFSYVVLGITPRPSCNDRKVPTTKLRHSLISPTLPSSAYKFLFSSLSLHAPLMLFLSAWPLFWRAPRSPFPLLSYCVSWVSLLGTLIVLLFH